MEWPPPDGIAMCQVGGVVNAKMRKGVHGTSYHHRIDLAKNNFQLHGARADGSVAFRKKVSRAKLLDFVAEQPRGTVAMEACGGAHHWGREISGLGHAVRLIPPVYVKPTSSGRRTTLRTPRRSARGLAADHAVCGCEDGGTVAADRVGPSSITVLKRKRSRPSPGCPTGFSGSSCLAYDLTGATPR